jgi:putative NIF3 family GTP cyclohydrolase 1 type 2
VVSYFPAQMIITYHPLIFGPIKRITQNDWKQRIIVSCLENRIAVYSPHTAWDSCFQGVNDWLIRSIPNIQPASVKPIVPNALNPLLGPGRRAELSVSITLRDAIASIKNYTVSKYN